jgi:hypothetical protein
MNPLHTAATTHLTPPQHPHPRQARTNMSILLTLLRNTHNPAPNTPLTKSLNPEK